MLDLLRRIPDRVERDSYVPRLAQLAGIDERILRDELARGPRPMPVRPIAVEPAAESDGSGVSPLEREALTLLLVDPVLAGERAAEPELPFRDESARALWTAWSAALTAPDGRPELEAFVASLDPATAALARDLLASARERGIRADLETDRDALRDVLLRLRKERVQERLADLQALISVGSQDGDDNDGIGDLERQFQILHLEREQLEQAINPAAALAGQRRK
jgi:DNA primase